MLHTTLRFKRTIVRRLDSPRVSVHGGDRVEFIKHRLDRRFEQFAEHRLDMFTDSALVVRFVRMEAE